MVSGRFFCAAKGNPAGYLRREPVSDIDLWVRNLLSLVTENIETEELGLIFRVLTFDMSIGDLTALDQLRKTDQLTEFAKSTNDLIKNDGYKKVSNARKNTREFAQSSKIDQIDLVHFCENIGNQEGKDLADALKGAIKYNRTSSSMTDAHGLAIYFPYQKTGKVSNALNLFKKIGMDSEYSKCIQQFASTETAGQMSAGGTSNPYSSLTGSLLGGGSVNAPSGGSSDAIMSMLSM